MAAFDKVKSGITELDTALDYRKRRGLDKRDEQMALLVQRVSGSSILTCRKNLPTHPRRISINSLRGRRK